MLFRVCNQHITGIPVRCGVADPHNQALHAQSRTIEKIRSKPAQLRKIWHNLCTYLNKYHFPKVIWWFQVIFSPFFVEIPRKFYQLVRQKQNGAHSVERDCALVQKTKGVPSAHPSCVFYGPCAIAGGPLTGGPFTFPQIGEIEHVLHYLRKSRKNT